MFPFQLLLHCTFLAKPHSEQTQHADNSVPAPNLLNWVGKNNKTMLTAPSLSPPRNPAVFLHFSPPVFQTCISHYLSSPPASPSSSLILTLC